MEPTNAWDRAQQAIDRAQRRNGTVVTPDNAESPFDASKTQMIPAMFPQNGSPATPGSRGRPAPAPRPPADARRSGQGPDGRRAAHRRPEPDEPETTPVDVSDPTLMRALPSEAPTVRTAATRPRTAPFPAQGTPVHDSAGPGPDDTPTTPPVGIRLPWWKRLFGRR